ncbi:3-hydroxybenzoate 6-hydroxylase [Streptomyces sp. HNM0575]|nr:FAD-dependent monooxygenase [Streptomyces sp. HNM0575]NLU71168.1 3-hydroxybenzoate 6-hydroxylase [Streptomyces sp. HNM0575]
MDAGDRDEADVNAEDLDVNVNAQDIGAVNAEGAEDVNLDVDAEHVDVNVNAEGAEDVDVVVAGGGIAGLAGAYALATAGDGLRVRVLERAPDFTEIGAGLQLAPNATRVLRRWGLLDEVVGLGVLPRRLVFRDMLDGTELTRLDLDDRFEARYGAPYVLIHRSDLLQVLVTACERAGVDLVPDHDVRSVRTEGDRAVVHAAGARTLHRAQVALAADGLRSRLRSRISDDEPVPSGYAAYRGAFPVAEVADRLGEDALRDVVVHIGPGCHLVQYPLRAGEIFNTVAVFASPAFRRGESEWGGPDELDAVFAGACEGAQRGVKSLWRDRRWPMYDREPIPEWTAGRLALTGDAAHPMLQYLAQGACQALEDAACLAAETVRHRAPGGGCDWPRALRSYEAARTVRTAEVQSAARAWGETWHVDGFARTLRNTLFRDRDPADFRHIDWLYGAQ